MPGRNLDADGSIRWFAVVMATALIANGYCAASYAAEADSPLDTLMHELAQRRGGHAAFVERQFLALLERPLESSGELFYEAPDHIEKRTLLPRPASLILDGAAVRIRRGARTYTVSLRDYPQLAPLLESIRGTLAGDRSALERHFTVAFESVPDQWTLGLVPRDSKVAAVVARIRISGAGATVHEIEMRQADGDRSVMTIQDLSGK